MNIVYESDGEPLAFEKFACELIAPRLAREANHLSDRFNAATSSGD
jgi:hypothetical protein